MSILTILKTKLVGSPLNPFNPGVLRHVSLVAFLAWVGLGADGLSSACYGPEEAYLALGQQTHLALYIAAAIAVTVFIISLGYNQVIELFPSGGGGYKVASQLLGPYLGLVSGAALLVDYALTITVSIASSVDALFSLLPSAWVCYKLLVEIGIALLLVILNLRGMKESIRLLLPIFLGFFILHVGLIVYGITYKSAHLLPLIPDTVRATQYMASTVGWVPLLGLILHAYSLGGGTFTGLEAVSNNVNVLSEPRVKTGKWTMFYMATSLSFTAAGIILLYLLWQVHAVPGQTLNAVVFHEILGNSALGKVLLVTTLLFEAGLLLVGANTGYLAGPSVMANMALDGWLPKRFCHLSSRLVIQNGVILFGLAALIILLGSHGKVEFLVVLYSINVFITFSLSLLGLCVYWAKHKRQFSLAWLGNFLFLGLALLVTSAILCMTLYTKFLEGGWVTAIITSAVIIICLLTKKHYQAIEKKLAVLDAALQPAMPSLVYLPLDPHQPTAVVLLGKSKGMGMQILMGIQRTFPNHFKNFIFIRIGIVDVNSFMGACALSAMRSEVDSSLHYFVEYCQQQGLPAQAYAGYGTDIVDELAKLADHVSYRFPQSIFFTCKLIFDHDHWLTHILHNGTATALQRQLHLQGKELVILPMRI